MLVFRPAQDHHRTCHPVREALRRDRPRWGRARHAGGSEAFPDAEHVTRPTRPRSRFRRTSNGGLAAPWDGRAAGRWRSRQPSPRWVIVRSARPDITHRRATARPLQRLARTFAVCRGRPNFASPPAAMARSSRSPAAQAAVARRASARAGDRVRPRLHRGDHDDGVQAGRGPRPRPLDRLIPPRGDYEHNRLNHDRTPCPPARLVVGPSESSRSGRSPPLGTWPAVRRLRRSPASGPCSAVVASAAGRPQDQLSGPAAPQSGRRRGGLAGDRSGRHPRAPRRQRRACFDRGQRRSITTYR